MHVEVYDRPSGGKGVAIHLGDASGAHVVSPEKALQLARWILELKPHMGLPGAESTTPTIGEMTPEKLFAIGEDDRLPTDVRRQIIEAAAIWTSSQGDCLAGDPHWIEHQRLETALEQLEAVAKFMARNIHEESCSALYSKDDDPHPSDFDGEAVSVFDPRCDCGLAEQFEILPEPLKEAIHKAEVERIAEWRKRWPPAPEVK